MKRSEQTQELMDNNVTFEKLGLSFLQFTTDRIFEKIYENWTKLGKPSNVTLKIEINFGAQTVSNLEIA